MEDAGGFVRYGDRAIRELGRSKLPAPAVDRLAFCMVMGVFVLALTTARRTPSPRQRLTPAMHGHGSGAQVMSKIHQFNS